MIEAAAAVMSTEGLSALASRLPEAANAQAKPGINQAGLSGISGDHIADGFRAHLDNLLSVEARARAGGVGASGQSEVVKSIGGGVDPQGTKVIGETKPASDAALQGLTAAFEYSTNMALVSMVLGGLTNGVTTLTSRGG